MSSLVNRRDFMKKSAQGAAVAVTVPAFLSGKLDQAVAGTKKEMSLQDYFNHFGVSEKDVNDVIAAGLAKGGDYCDVYFQHTIYNYVGLEDNSVNRASTDVDFGVGIRVLKGDQTGYSFTEEITPKAMKLAAQTAANIANDSKTVKPVELKMKETPNHYPIETSWENVSIDKKIPILQEINEKVYKRDKRVIKSSVYFVNSTEYVMVATSDGKVACDYRPMYRIGTSCTAEENGKKERNGFNLSSRQGFEIVTPKNVERLAHEAVDRTVELFTAVKPEAGEMPVIMGAGNSGILLHEAIGHGMEADFNRKKVSIFSDKIGKPVAEKFINIVDSGLNENARGSLNVDDEANDVQETMLVENGILTSYLHDRISANHYKVKPTGNGRRQSFRYPVMPRMRNTYMLNGPHTEEEMIATVKKGIYCKDFTNGQVFIGAGDFTFYVQSGYLIEDGKLTKPIKDVNIIGNGPEVLKNITMAANNFKLAEGGWTCGKDGQSVPVSQGLPSVKVSSITVGGVNS